MFDSVSGAASGAAKAIGTSSFDQHLQKMRSLRERGVFDKSDAYVIENFVKGDPERLEATHARRNKPDRSLYRPQAAVRNPTHGQ